MKKLLAVAAFAMLAAPLFATVELETSINDVFNRGSSELAGSITMNVTGEDFRDASTDTPIFIRVTPDHNSFLAETLVRQASSDPVIRLPIWLAMKLNRGGGLITMAALPEAVSIVRWVEGESAFWIRVQQSSDQWLQAPTGLVGPNQDLKVSWEVGISARQSDTNNDQAAATANLPFNTRDSGALEGDFEEATSTLICVNLTASNLLADGTTESLLNYDIIAFDDDADLGGGVYSGPAGNDTGINFTNDFSIARGKSRECEVTVVDTKGGAGNALLCIFRAASNQSVDEFVKATNTLTFELRCRAGGNFLNTNLVRGAYINFDTNNRGHYGFDELQNVRFTTTNGALSLIGFSDVVPGSGFNNNGRTLWTQVDLVYDGEPISLNNSRRISVEVCVYTHYTDDPIAAIVDWQVTLVNHEGELDEFPYDGPDQVRRCPPSQFAVGDPLEFLVGNYVACQGNPVVIFFPYLPRLVDNSDFFAGLSYVNQGGVDLEIEAIFYDEWGRRFTGDLGELDVKNQNTWLIVQNNTGVAEISGAGENNNGVVVVPTSSDPAVPSDEFGRTRSSFFVRGTFPAEFLDDVFSGDLDGYLLIGALSTGSIDGAYLPRNYDNDIPGQNADLPLWRSKTVKSYEPVRTSSFVTADEPAKYAR
jgi:hypothetical protein